MRTRICKGTRKIFKGKERRKTHDILLWQLYNLKANPEVHIKLSLEELQRS